MAKSLNFNTSNFKNRKKKNVQTNRVILRNYCTHRHATPLFPIFSWENREKKNIIQRYIQNPVNYSILFYLTGI